MQYSRSADSEDLIADLTKRLAAAEQALAERDKTARAHGLQEEMLEAFEHAPIGIALVLPDGKWFKVNKAICDLVGYSESELRDLTFQDITHPDDLDLDLQGVRKMMAGEIHSYGMEKRYIHADGRIVPVYLNVSLARDREGQPLYFIAHIQDITARKQAEEKHRVEEERILRQRDALIAFSNESRIGDDLSATIRTLTETAARTLGVARVSVWRYSTERSSIRCVDLYEPETDRHSAGLELSALAYPNYFEALKGMDVIAADDAHHDPRTREFSEGYLAPLNIGSMLDAPIHLGGDEEGVLCHEHVGPPRRWTADEVTFAVAVANRVSLALEASEHKRLAEELSRALAQIEQMLKHNPGVVFRLKVEDDRLVPISLSNSITTLLGYTIEEASEPGWWASHLHPEDREKAFAAMEELFRQGTLRCEFRFRHKDGVYRWIEDNQRLLRDASGRPMESVGVWTDITERRDTEARLERINKELLEVSRLAGMAEVATSVLHNVGNVLNSVNISCSVIEQKLAKSRIGNVAKVAHSLKEHAADLPGFLATHPSGQKLVPFLDSLAARLQEEQDEVLHELQSLGHKIDHIKVIVGTQQNYAKVSGLTESVNLNDLVDSSLRLNEDSLARHGVQVVREFSPVPPALVEKHKILQILVNLIQNAKQACEASGAEEKQVAVKVFASEGKVKVEVSDNGVGIPAENLTRIFAHGFSTKPGGHGFGLHGCAVAAREMGGSLTAASEGPGMGSTFTLELPTTDGTQPESPVIS